MNETDDKSTNKHEGTSLADRLPELDAEQVEGTRGATQKAWAYGNLSAGRGYVWTHEDLGVSLQVTSEDTIRLLAVVDHPFCLLMVAKMVATLEHLGLRMDLSQAIVSPYVDREDVVEEASTGVPEPESGKMPAWRWSRWTWGTRGGASSHQPRQG